MLCSLAGLERGIAGEPCDFTIVTKDAGPGGLSLAVHGPSKAEITCSDNGDGTCSVQYVPEEPGKFWSSAVSRSFSPCRKLEKEGGLKHLLAIDLIFLHRTYI